MKQRFLLLLFFGLAWNIQAQTLLQSQSFENNETVNYSASTVASGSANIYFLRSQLPVAGYSNNGSDQVSTLTNINGSWFWASESVRRDPNASTPVRANPAANLTMNVLNVAGKTNLSVTVALADAAGLPGNSVPRWETDDYVRVQYNLDNTGWVTIGQFVGDDPGTGGAAGRLRRDANLDGISNNNLEPNSPTLTQAMTDYSFSIPGSGSSLQVRVQIDDDGFSEDFGFDNIRVYGSTAASAAPVLAGIESTALSYAEGEAAKAITGTLTVTDSDSPTLSSAVITISTNYQASEDRLLFTGDGTTGNIVAGTFDNTLGKLTLTSSGSTATVAQWQNALRKVLYQNVDAADASTLTRAVSFNVTDAASVGSNTVTRSITVTATLDGPYVGLPYVEPFETEGEGTRYASNHFFTQNGAQFQRTSTNPIPFGTTFTNLAGSYYWVAVNTGANASLNPTGVLNGSVTTKPINAAGYANLHFQIRVGASTAISNGNSSNWRTSDYLQLRYRLSGSSTWTVFGLFRGTNTSSDPTVYGGIFRQDANPNGTSTPGVAPTGTQLREALQNFDFTLPTSLNGQTLEFQMLAVNADGVNFLAFDQIQITGTVNNPPVIANQTRSIAENSANGTAVGAVIAASDPDAGQVLSYSILSGNTNNTFALNAASGQLTVANAAALNYEVTPSYALIVQVSDNATPALSATATVTVNVINVNELAVSITAKANVSCNGGNTGAATVTATGESVPFSYSWRNTTTNTTVAQTTSAVTGLAAGVYSVTVTATASGFTAATSFTISQPTALSLATSHSNVSTLGTSTGTASVSVSGGTPAYAYDWTPGNPTGDGTSSISSLSAGTYTVRVTDTNGCTATGSTTVTTDPDLTLLLYARPGLVYGSSPLSVVVDVVETNGVTSSGPITVKVTRSAQLTLTLDGSLSNVGGRAVQNGSWSLSSDAGYYILTTNQSITGGSALSFGLSGQLTAGSTTGILTCSATITGGGESRLTNNTDADKIEYFQQ